MRLCRIKMASKGILFVLNVLCSLIKVLLVFLNMKKLYEFFAG